jgi:hypothetical protein
MVDTFCYWDAKSKPDLIIIIINQTIVTVLLSITALRMPNLLRLWKSGLSIDVRKITLIHALIIAWALSTPPPIQSNQPSISTPSASTSI